MENLEKNKSPLVSIIIPVYNGANYVQEAVDSALAQTYENIEIIVVNDGSTDNMEEIAKSYGDKIRYFAKENGGVSTALNLGLEKMRGEYFSWLSHDDVYCPNKIERQVEYLNSLKNKNVIPYSDYELIDEKSKRIKKVVIDHKMIEHKPEYVLLRSYINGNTLLIPKKAFEEYGYFDENLKCTQDYQKWFEMMKTYKFVHIPEILAKYRIHQKQDTLKNPKVVSEGNPLWIEMMENVSDDIKRRLEGSELNFYKEMVFFLRQTPHKEAMDFANKKANEILAKENKPAVDFTKAFVMPKKNELKDKIRFVLFSPKKFLKKYFC